MATRPSPIDLSVSAATRSDVDPQSDEGLVREMIGGSEAALGSLYDRHVNTVFGAALRTGRDRGIAAEVVQETFLALWNQAERFDPARGSLLSWLLTIARNRAIDRLRSAGRHDRAAAFSSFGQADQDDLSTAEWLTSSGELIGSAGPEPTPEVALTSREDRSAIEAAVAALDPMERAVITLAYGSGLSQSEIAARLGLADRDGQDADATRAAPTPRPARGDAREGGRARCESIRPSGPNPEPERGCADPRSLEGGQRRRPPLGRQRRTSADGHVTVPVLANAWHPQRHEPTGCVVRDAARFRYRVRSSASSTLTRIAARSSSPSSGSHRAGSRSPFTSSSRSRCVTAGSTRRLAGSMTSATRSATSDGGRDRTGRRGTARSLAACWRTTG